MSIEEFFYTLQESGVEVQLMGRQLKVHARKGTVESAILEKIKARKPEFIEFLETLKEDEQDIPVIPENKEGYYEMSHAQKRLWVLDQLEPGRLHTICQPRICCRVSLIKKHLRLPLKN